MTLLKNVLELTMPVLIKFSKVNKNQVKHEYFEAVYDGTAEECYKATKNWLQNPTHSTTCVEFEWTLNELDISDYTFTDLTLQEFAMLYKLFVGSYGYTCFNNG